MIGAVVLTFVGPFYWVMPAPRPLAALIAQATLGAFGHLFLVRRTLGWRRPSWYQLFTYMMLLNAVGARRPALRRRPRPADLVGATVVAGAGIYAAIRTHKRAEAGS